MTCTDFLDHFSDFYDGKLGADAAEPFRRHLEDCRRCRRYHRVVERGGEVLRSIPAASPRAGFRERLRHSIHLLEEEERRRRIPSSGRGSAGFFVFAAIAAAVAMWPVIGGGDSGVELPAIVVQEPSSPRLALDAPALAEPLRDRLRSVGSSRRMIPVSLPEPELWSQSNALLYQYSSLYSRYREPTVVRVDLR